MRAGQRSFGRVCTPSHPVGVRRQPRPHSADHGHHRDGHHGHHDDDHRYEGERTQLTARAEHKELEGLAAYREQKNQRSTDGLAYLRAAITWPTAPPYMTWPTSYGGP